MTKRLILRAAGLLLALTALLGPARPAAAQISVVVAASSTYRPSEREILELFSGLKTQWADGTRVQLVDQADTPVGKRFYEAFLHQSAARVRRDVTRLVFSGEAVPPLRMDGSAAVKRAVADNPARIGYIATAALDDTVRELLRIP